MKSLLLLALTLWSATAQAATYYVDYAAGSDSNNGIAKETPWKRCPGMNGFAGAYSHSTGDRFIFKGGVTWPQPVFQLRIDIGGDSITPDYYGTDQTWFSGASWTRPKFDFQNTSTGAWTDNYGLWVRAHSITFDGLEILRHRGEPNHGSAAMHISYSGSGTVTVTNCLVRDWSLPSPLPPGVGAGNLGGGIWWTAGSGVVRVTHTELHQQNASSSSGIAIRAANVVEYCHIHDAGTGWTGGGTVRYNRFNDLRLPTVDPTAHLAAIKTFAVSDVYGNLIYNLDGSCAPVELSSGYESSSGTESVYNNVIFNTAVQPCIWLKTDRANYAAINVRILNNTVARSGGLCVSIYDGGAGVELASADVRNNHFITEGDPVSIGGVDTVTEVNNLTHTVSQAAALGYSSGNYYQPTSGASPTVEQGLDLSAWFTKDRLEVTRSVPWDIGAYEWTAAGGGAGTAVLSASSYSCSEEDPYVTITANRVDGSTGALNVSYATANGSAIAGVNYTAASGAFAWLTGDTAAKNVNVPLIDANTTGNPTFTFTITGAVSAPSSATVTIAGSGTPGIPLLEGLAWDADQGEMDAPFVLSGSDVYQPEDTQGAPDAGGRLTFSFVPAVTGNYKAKGVAKAEQGWENSLYVNLGQHPPIDPPTDPDSIWDLPVATGFQTNYVGWRGAGTFEAPEIPLKTWSLAAGTTNTLIFRGREPRVYLRRVELELIDPPETPVPVISVGSSTANGHYKTGSQISIQVQFSTNVTVTGTPTLVLNSGGSATYSSGSTTDTLTFLYEPEAGQDSQDLDYAGTDSLVLNGGSIRHESTDATLALPAPSAAGSLGHAKDLVVDTTAPTIAIGLSSLNQTAAGPVSWPVNYDDLNWDRATLSAGDVTVHTTGTAAAAVVTVLTESGKAFAVTLSSITGTGTLAISIGSGTGRDLAGNLAPSHGQSETVIVETRNILHIRNARASRMIVTGE